MEWQMHGGWGWGGGEMRRELHLCVQMLMYVGV